MWDGTTVCVCACTLTVGVQEGRVELSGQQRIGHVSEELFEQRCHIMDAVLLVQLDVHPYIEVLSQLRRTHTHTGQTEVTFPRWTQFLQNRIWHIINFSLIFNIPEYSEG